MKRKFTKYPIMASAEDRYQSISKEICQVIRDKVFQPILTDEDTIQRSQSYFPYTRFVISKGLYGIGLVLSPKPGYILVTIYTRGVYYGTHNSIGLTWLADLASGGTGSYASAPITKMPKEMRNTLKEFIDIIVEELEARGFELLTEPKPYFGNYRFRVTTPEYDKLIGNVQ